MRAANRRRHRCGWQTLPIFEMYRNAVDQVTRNEIAAAAAAHHELGRDYDDAVAESLIDRIGAEIDKRVDARMRAGAPGLHSPAQIRQSSRSQAAWVGAGIGAGLTGLVAIIAEHGSKTVVAAMLTIWVILAVCGLGAAVVDRFRGTPRR
jgi:hypothetical protein